LIGDMVGSRELEPPQRAETQERFTTFIDGLNRRFSAALLAKFVITVGDEFQALIRDPAVLPDVIWDVDTGFGDRELRLGFGYGRLDTSVGEYAINVDGPALHRARDAVSLAKKDGDMGGVFCGFGSDFDILLNGMARLLWFHRSQRTEQQMRVLGMLRKGMPQVEIAEELQLTRQAISDHARAAGWSAYRQGESGLRAALELFQALAEEGTR
jgi:hypothetical protein